MGAAAVLVARALDAEVIAVDLLPERLELAASFGARETVDSASRDALEAVLEAAGGRGVEVAIDCSGAPAGQNLALDAAAKQGHVALVGESRATQIDPSDQVIGKLLTVVGGWYFPLYEWAEIVRLVVDQQLPVEDLVTHRFDIDDAARPSRCSTVARRRRPSSPGRTDRRAHPVARR
jgi:L-iditol 2-dehydrogenase